MTIAINIMATCTHLSLVLQLIDLSFPLVDSDSLDCPAYLAGRERKQMLQGTRHRFDTIADPEQTEPRNTQHRRIWNDLHRRFNLDGRVLQRQGHTDISCLCCGEFE
jgi:hypothetical protein